MQETEWQKLAQLLVMNSLFLEETLFNSIFVITFNKLSSSDEILYLLNNEKNYDL
jgi:DNA polymerase III delta subunit